jgi:hypothetical protein
LPVAVGELGHGDGDAEVDDRHRQERETGLQRGVQRAHRRDVRAAPPGSPGGVCASGKRGALVAQASRLRALSSTESSIGRGAQPSVVRAFSLE